MNWFKSFSVLVVCSFICSCTSKENIISIERNPIKVIGAKAKLQLVDMERLSHYLNSKNDTVYVINFWATWCVPCIQELPDFEKTISHFKEKKVKWVLVSLNAVKDSSLVTKFLEKRNYNAENLLFDGGSPNEWIPKISSTWSGSIPATIIRNSRKSVFFEGKLNEEELTSNIKRLIK